MIDFVNFFTFLLMFSLLAKLRNILVKVGIKGMTQMNIESE